MTGTTTLTTSAGPNHLLIRASAGTGKTHWLSSRYLSLIDAGYPVTRILATTFTRNAAAEISDRIVQRLAKATVDPVALEQLRVDLQRDSLDVDRCHELLAQLTRQLHRIRVSTLDSYFSQVARAFGLELGLPPDWTILDDQADGPLRHRALQRMLAETETTAAIRLMHLLFKGEATRGVRQMLLEAIGEVYDLYLETKPDGSAAWEFVQPQSELSPEELFTVIKALESLKVPAGMVKPHQSSTLAALEEDWDAFLKKGLPAKLAAGETTFHRKPIPPEVMSVYATLLDHVRALRINRIVQQTRGAFELAKAFESTYESLKLQSNAIAFDDVPRLLAALGDSRESLRQLAYRLDAQVDHLLLDEFQDTSVLQWQSLRPLAERITGRSVTRRNAGDETGRDETGRETVAELAANSAARPPTSFFCVGDVKQAIYRWRGGQAEILDSMPHRLPDLTVASLNLSYRSSPAVIETVNRLFTGLLQHDNLEEYHEGFATWDYPRHETHRKEQSGYACLQTACADRDDQAWDTIWSTAQLAKRLQQNHVGCSIGILVRTNAAVGKTILALRELGVEASEEGGNPLTDSAAVQHVLAAMRLADHPGDGAAYFQLSHGPLREILGLPSEPLTADTAYRSDIAHLVADRIRRRLLDDGYGRCVQTWSDAMQAYCSVREARRMSQLIELAFLYDSRCTLRPSDFVRYVEATKIGDPTTADVRVMTIHQSKGLEFDIVLLTELGKPFINRSDFAVQRDPKTHRPMAICRHAPKEIRQLLPPRYQAIFHEDVRRRIHEYLCGLYVAVTRARHAIYMMIDPEVKPPKALPKSTSGLLRAALADGRTAEPDSVLFECGDPNWRADQSKPPKQSEWDLSPLRLSPFRLQSKSTPHEARLTTVDRAAMSPAELFQATEVEATEFGIVMHAWLESIEWLTNAPSAEALRQIVAGMMTQHIEIEMAIAAFRRALRHPTLQRLFKEAEYRADVADWLSRSAGLSAGAECELQVRNEQATAYRDEGRLVQGRIDRLVVIVREAKVVAVDIVDFKTDRDASHGVDAYAQQLRRYRQAAASMFRLPASAIRTRLVYTHDGRVVDVDGTTH